MARRTAGRAVPPTAEGRAAYREEDARSPGASAAFSWSVVLILSALCCGYCGADTEFSILEEAQVLADQMKKLSSQELGVFTMQVRKASLNVPNVEVRKSSACVLGGRHRTCPDGGWNLHRGEL